MNDLRAICFAMDDTIVAREDVLGECLQPVLGVAVAAYPALDQARLTSDFLAASEVVVTGRGFLDRREVFRSILHRQGVVDAILVDAMARTYDTLRRTQLRTMPGAQAALEALSAHFRLALITNCRAAATNEKLEILGLRDYFGAIAIAEEVGAAKPDPAIFLWALAELGVLPDQALMVGDYQDTDLAGARGAGMRTAWYNWRGEALGNGIPQPDLEIRDLDRLVRILLPAGVP